MFFSGLILSQKLVETDQIRKVGPKQGVVPQGPCKASLAWGRSRSSPSKCEKHREKWENHGEDIRKYDEIVEKTKGWQLLKGVFLELPRLGAVRTGKPARIMNYCHDIWNQRENSTCQYKGRSNTMWASSELFTLVIWSMIKTNIRISQHTTLRNFTWKRNVVSFMKKSCAKQIVLSHMLQAWYNYIYLHLGDVWLLINKIHTKHMGGGMGTLP